MFYVVSFLRKGTTSIRWKIMQEELPLEKKRKVK